VFSRLLYSLLIYFVCFYVGPMLLLTGPDRRKYLDDLKAKKEAEGNTASDQAGVVTPRFPNIKISLKIRVF
jgi:hypothetical protein